MKNLGHGIHRTEQVVSLLGAGRALRASLRRSVRGSSQQVRRGRHRNQRRLSAHIPRLHPLFTYAAQAVRTGASLLEPVFLARLSCSVTDRLRIAGAISTIGSITCIF